MGRAAGWIAKIFRRRRADTVEIEPEPEADPAEELRRKLAETRGREPETEPAPAPVEEPPPSQADELEHLRRGVHERARALGEEMRRSKDRD